MGALYFQALERKYISLEITKVFVSAFSAGKKAKQNKHLVCLYSANFGISGFHLTLKQRKPNPNVRNCPGVQVLFSAVVDQDFKATNLPMFPSPNLLREKPLTS